MSTVAEPATGANYQVRALERALDILDAFDVATPELTITRLAERTGLPKSTVIRLVSILVERRFLERPAEAESVRIGVRAFEVGNRATDLQYPVISARRKTQSRHRIL